MNIEKLLRDRPLLSGQGYQYDDMQELSNALRSANLPAVQQWSRGFIELAYNNLEKHHQSQQARTISTDASRQRFFSLSHERQVERFGHLHRESALAQKLRQGTNPIQVQPVEQPAAPTAAAAAVERLRRESAQHIAELRKADRRQLQQRIADQQQQRFQAANRQRIIDAYERRQDYITNQAWS